MKRNRLAKVITMLILVGIVLIIQQPQPPPRLKQNRKFEILCTSSEEMMQWGSFKIRCVTFKLIAEHHVNSVRISICSHEDMLASTSGKNMCSSKTFDATMSIKSDLNAQPRLGRVFVDVVDAYSLDSESVSPATEIFVQSEYHGKDRFMHRKYHVVEHWYNSFLQDMLAGTSSPAFNLPTIEDAETLRLATVWANKRVNCPTISSWVSNVSYSCINKPFAISRWYKDYLQHDLLRLERLLHDPLQGEGRLYFELFWNYDALVVPAKDGDKLRYGNVQRAISQMRSGVPVLLEIRGEVLEDFVSKYNYTCTFARIAGSGVRSREYWTFDEAVEAMKNASLRRRCQSEGLLITNDFSPSKIVTKQLQLMGLVVHS